jgi:hypothetical protein
MFGVLKYHVEVLKCHVEVLKCHTKICHDVDMGFFAKLHVGSWNMHVDICNVHVETQHLFLMSHTHAYAHLQLV